MISPKYTAFKALTYIVYDYYTCMNIIFTNISGCLKENIQVKNNFNLNTLKWAKKQQTGNATRKKYCFWIKVYVT